MGLAVGMLVIYTLLFGSASSWRDGDAIASGLGPSLATRSVRETGGNRTTVAGEDNRQAEAGQPAAEGPEPVVWGSDPFVREWVLTDELAELNLKAITMGGEKAYVLINDQILEQGDMIGGKRIAGIESDKVILEQGGRSFILMLGE